MARPLPARCPPGACPVRPASRLSSGRKPPVLATYPDGSFLSRIGDVEVRIVICEITIATSAGRRTGAHRLATTLLDHRTHPAFGLVRLYHERWEVESAYFEIKKSILGRRVLRSRTWPGLGRLYTAAYLYVRTSVANHLSTN
ncbi:MULTISPECIES: hypothetical protein [unclassified Streptomyces]|uniref:hypothetical protein n=1 Tax=unclassified Streptomyces TaxID=2593676 RepID=UPI002252C004|nr:MULTISPECIES: hypothetical protein [unclassified Streptomyces]WSP59262.1 hypothetical protein OG306_36445 [Streptomyces sp. NBC_01241]WSU20217.1 hypothetical protein OG508_03905 [Streptomyces sp. NBC_01108]MCX4791013.1 hypothetical protein [Streptomyces sp. NBC_01221]MCX4793261.1 hypothetical protein [Streptomyces sp. NBC_01242]WSJ34703.1 hypothetical protein OG772_00570 [Streptomyces sp. NBC_01321]